ncbi:MAG: ferrous iron transport protein A [Desulfovibrionaceae bacterium]|nr:ferrous iron transport protein A [Desulfovibrionaceae bacterium]MBF0513297.1 ferrous iron transport protein A [Desulfovibrionaceae bacterium]
MSELLQSKPINAYPGGATVVIERLDGGCGCRGHLCALGLAPGTKVVVRDSHCDGCRVFVRESELILGQGMAEKILAVPCRLAPGAD